MLTRPECGLCDDFHAQLLLWGQTHLLPQLDIRDVDGDPELARRHGLDVPVLLLDGVKVCAHHLDAQELQRLLRPR